MELLNYNDDLQFNEVSTDWRRPYYVYKST